MKFPVKYNRYHKYNLKGQQVLVKSSTEQLILYNYAQLASGIFHLSLY